MAQQGWQFLSAQKLANVPSTFNWMWQKLVSGRPHLKGPWTANQSNESNMVSMVQHSVYLEPTHQAVVFKWSKRRLSTPLTHHFFLCPCNVFCKRSLFHVVGSHSQDVHLLLSSLWNPHLAMFFCPRPNAMEGHRPKIKQANRQTQKKHTNLHLETKHSSWKTSNCLMRQTSWQ